MTAVEQFEGEGGRGFVFRTRTTVERNRGLAAQDIRHRFVVSYVYQLPFGHGRQFMNQNALLTLSWASGRRRESPRSRRQSGRRGTGLHRANTNAGSMRPTCCTTRIAARGRSHARKLRSGLILQPSSTCARSDGPFSFGNAGRNIVIGPGEDESDFGLTKVFLSTEM